MIFNKRASGVLLHPSSLPGKYGIGTLGEEACKFVDWLKEFGQKVWQMLPLGPTDWSHSPYQAYSAFAGNPDLIDLDFLVRDGYLTQSALVDQPVFPSGKVNFKIVLPYRQELLKSAFVTFKQTGGFNRSDFHQFWDQHWWWLESWSLFDACRASLPGKDWTDWEEALQLREESALASYYSRFKDQVEYSRFMQFLFFEQWFSLKNYANRKGISIFGDLPLYVAFNSSDVWSNQSLFLLDEKRGPTLVGGVPPDYFSQTGQLWGNPLFDWNRMKEQGFEWWMARMHFNLRMFDMVRIDHFRGLESFWAIPAGEKTAVNGSWMKAKGEEMLQLLQNQIGSLPIVAEDLGLITPEVDMLRRKFSLPGMKVLQFAFSEEADNTHLPHNYTDDFVVYTGTHDNNTANGWMRTLNQDELSRVQDYLGTTLLDNWQLIRKAEESVAKLAIIPMQDILNLSASARMNKPGTTRGNWIWRMQQKQLKAIHGKQLLKLTKLYGRVD
ncbi:MAG: 4-alpha-glucanotransferase [Prolixibacteraceae bacterium]|jgi:4-alpha-glucanotransferase|nr:4-alpha-glucanotransferase [Prolixibacteraceae bacterium]